MPGMGPPPHHHARSETFVMLEGELDLMVGDQPPQRLRAGMVAHAPAGEDHGYRIQVDGTGFLKARIPGAVAHTVELIVTDLRRAAASRDGSDG